MHPSGPPALFYLFLVLQLNHGWNQNKGGAGQLLFRAWKRIILFHNVTNMYAMFVHLAKGCYPHKCEVSYEYLRSNHKAHPILGEAMLNRDTGKFTLICRPMHEWQHNIILSKYKLGETSFMW